MDQQQPQQTLSFTIKIKKLPPCELTESIKRDIEECHRLDMRINSMKNEIKIERKVTKVHMERIQTMREQKAIKRQRILKSLGNINYLSLPDKKEPAGE
jgi:hypothetical protein